MRWNAERWVAGVSAFFGQGLGEAEDRELSRLFRWVLVGCGFLEAMSATGYPDAAPELVVAAGYAAHSIVLFIASALLFLAPSRAAPIMRLTGALLAVGFLARTHTIVGGLPATAMDARSALVGFVLLQMYFFSIFPARHSRYIGIAFASASIAVVLGTGVWHYYFLASNPQTLMMAVRFSLGLSVSIAVLSRFVSLLADRTRLEQEAVDLRQRAHTDPLTGLRNRRAFELAFSQEAARVARCAEPLSLLMIDLDRFKVINDMHGHDVGDRVIKGMALVLRDIVRTSDHRARWGGEEFVVLLPNIHILLLSPSAFERLSSCVISALNR